MEMEEMDLLEYWEIIVRRRWMILGLFVAAVVIALVLSLPWSRYTKPPPR